MESKTLIIFQLSTSLPLSIQDIIGLLIYISQWNIAVNGQYKNYQYSSSNVCSHHSQCNSSIGEICWRTFDGCIDGQCECGMNSVYQIAAGTCISVKVGGEHCTKQDKCPDGMKCRSGYCLCNTDYMTEDKTFCLSYNEKLLGERCSRFLDTCFQKQVNTYSSADVSCYNNICQCHDGYKTSGLSCVKWNVLEHGCLKNHHCQGGALCIDRICQCPTRYIAVAGNSKCAKINAFHDLKLGDICDEINESRYCAKDLICHKCAGQTYRSCVKFKEPRLKRFRSMASFIHGNRSSLCNFIQFRLTIVLLFLMYLNSNL